MTKKLFLALTLLIATVIAVYAAVGDFSFGSGNEFQPTNIMHHRADHEGGTGVVCYTDGDASGECVAYTVSGTTITDGTAMVVDSDWEINGYYSYGDVAFINATHFVVAFADDSADDDGYVEHFSVSGTTISDEGVKLEFNTGDVEHTTVAQTNTNVYAVCYNDETEGEDGECIACEYDPGVSTTCGSEVNIVAGGDDIEYPSMAQTDTNEFVVVYRQDGVDTLKANHGSVDGSEAITMGAIANASGATVVQRGQVCSSFEEGGTADRFFAAYNGAFVACTISGSTITCGTVQAPPGTWAYAGCTFISDTEVVATGSDSTNSDYMEAALYTVNWTTRAITETNVVDAVASDTCGVDPADRYCGRGIVTLAGYGTTSATIVSSYFIDGAGEDGTNIAATVVATGPAATGYNRVIQIY